MMSPEAFGMTPTTPSPSSPMAERLTELIVAMASIVSPFVRVSTTTTTTSPGHDPEAAAAVAVFVAALPLLPPTTTAGPSPPSQPSPHRHQQQQILGSSLQLLLQSAVSLLQRVPPCSPYFGSASLDPDLGSDLGPSVAGSDDLLGACCCPALLGMGVRLLTSSTDPTAPTGGHPSAPPTSVAVAAKAFLVAAAAALSERAESDADVAASLSRTAHRTRSTLGSFVGQPSSRRRSTQETPPFPRMDGVDDEDDAKPSPFAHGLLSPSPCPVATPRTPLEAVAACAVALIETALLPPPEGTSDPSHEGRKADHFNESHQNTSYHGTGSAESAPAFSTPVPQTGGSRSSLSGPPPLLLLSAALELAGHLGGSLSRYGGRPAGATAETTPTHSVATASKLHMLHLLRNSLNPNQILGSEDRPKEVDSSPKPPPTPSEATGGWTRPAMAMEAVRELLLQQVATARSAKQHRVGDSDGGPSARGSLGGVGIDGSGAASSARASWALECLSAIGPGATAMTRRAIRAATAAGDNGGGPDAGSHLCAAEGLRLLAAAASFLSLNPAEAPTAAPNSGQCNDSSGCIADSCTALMRLIVPLLIEAAAPSESTLSAVPSLRDLSLRLVTTLPSTPAGESHSDHTFHIGVPQ